MPSQNCNTNSDQLVYLLSAMDSGNLQLDFNVSAQPRPPICEIVFINVQQAAPVPAGRNVNGCRQKINKIKAALKPELDALKAGTPIAGPVDTTPTKKAATPRKCKTKADDEGNEAEITPKKGRGRPKKTVPSPEVEQEQEDLGVKTEVKDEDEDDILKEAEQI
jgi:hypothetical protein